VKTRSNKKLSANLATFEILNLFQRLGFWVRAVIRPSFLRRAASLSIRQKLGAPDRVFVVDVATANVRSHYACSEKGLAVIAQTARPVPRLGPGRLLFVDGATGKLIRSLETQAEPLDVLAVSVN
jgi:hypothetical protein